MKISGIYQTLAAVVCLGAILWFGQPFLVPLAYALLTAFVLYPVCKYFESKRMGKMGAIALSITLLCLLFGALITLLGYEMAVLSGKWPLVQQQIDPFLLQLQDELEREFGWTSEKQIAWARENLNELSRNAGAYISDTANAILGAVFNLIIIPVYVALILVYRGRLVEFAIGIAPEAFRDRMPVVIDDTIKVFSRFIRGMVLVYLSVGLLNTFGLWLVGVKNPFLYGMITAIMTIIPYFGIMISALLPITLAWLETGTLWRPLGIVTVFTVVQYLEANLIFPYIVGRFVNLNTLAAILAIFLGALFWGVSGMILFLPFFAVFRLFAEHFPELKPWSKLLGQ